MISPVNVKFPTPSLAPRTTHLKCEISEISNWKGLGNQLNFWYHIKPIFLQMWAQGSWLCLGYLIQIYTQNKQQATEENGWMKYTTAVRFIRKRGKYSKI